VNILINIFIIIIVCSGIIGAYAMTLTMLITIINGESKWGYFVFIYPCAPIILGFSILGFIGGVQMWHLFDEEGILRMIYSCWKENFKDSIVGSIVVIGWWITIIYLFNYDNMHI